MKDWQDKFLRLSWEDYITASALLAEKINHREHSADLIVAIARGGLTLAQILSDLLELPIASFTVQSYKSLQQIQQPHITYGVGGNLENKKIILVDDVCDSGKTFLRGLTYLEEMGAKRTDILTSCLHFKPHAGYQPAVFTQETDKWIIYPYETRETISQLTRIWQGEKLDTDIILSRLKDLGFNQIKISKYA